MQHNSKSSRNKDIVARRKEGFSLASLAKEFGISRERVRQILDKYGDETTVKRFQSRHTLTMKYKVPLSWVKKAEKTAQVSKYPGKLYSDKDIEKIQAALAGIISLQKCKVCGRQLQSARRHILCDSPGCARKNNASRRVHPAHTRRTGSIMQVAFDATKGVPPGSEWVSHGEALAAVGIFATFVSYMRYNNIIATKENPLRIHRATGRPTYLYSKTHVEAVGRAIKAYKEKEAHGQVENHETQDGIRQGPT
jgi:hypothetical protein